MSLIKAKGFINSYPEILGNSDLNFLQKESHVSATNRLNGVCNSRHYKYSNKTTKLCVNIYLSNKNVNATYLGIENKGEPEDPELGCFD
jgi:hypothetical protein